MKATHKMIAAIYARVSTEDQHCEMQMTELGGIADRMGWEKTVYTEKASTRKDRPVLTQLLADASKRKFDVVLVWKLDRFGRTVRELVDNIERLDNASVRFMCPEQGIDTGNRSATGKLIIHVLAAVAEFERDLIRERTLAGVAEYKRAYDAGIIGKHRHSKSGKDLPTGRPRRVFRRDEALQMRAQGMSFRAIAKALQVPLGTVYEAVRKA